MATIDFVPVAVQADALVYRATPLATGDTTNVLPVNEGSWDIGIHAYGTVGGSTVTVKGGIASAIADLATIEDAYGETLALTVLPFFKPIGPPVRQLMVTITAGAASGVTVDIIVTRKRV